MTEMADDLHHQHEAILKLTVLYAEGLKDTRFLGKMKTFAVIWIDPSLKLQTKTLTSSSPNPVYNSQLTFPLPFQLLENPNSHLTIQLLSRSSPIHHQKVIGSASLLLSEIRYATTDKTFNLQIWRPSGRAKGLLKVVSRIEYNSRVYSSSSGNSCVTGIPVENHEMMMMKKMVQEEQSGSVFDDQMVTSEGSGIYNLVIPSAPPMQEEEEIPVPEDEIPTPVEEKANVLRSVLIGFLGGVVAVATTVLIGTTGS